MHYAWTGEWPKNRAPRLVDFTLNQMSAADNVKLKAGMTYKAKVDVADADKDTLTFRWEIMNESKSQKTGGDREYIPETIRGLFEEDSDHVAQFVAPTRPGTYRLYVSIDDGNNHSAHANIPFLVEQQ